MASSFDFIVVGGGTAGCLLAAKLAHAKTQPTVLLIEAGGEPIGETLRSPYDRFTPLFTRPDLDHKYLTTSQCQLNNRVLPYARGKGLGGSTILNFMLYLKGSAEDYNRWAELVGDDNWRWEKTKENFKKIETYHTSINESYSKYANPKKGDHGYDGLVDVCLPPVLEKGVDVLADSAAAFGYPRNLDLNSGNPIGIGVFPASYAYGHRTTSATAHLAIVPDNLTIWTNSAVNQLQFEGKRVIGVELVDGRQAKSEKEVVLSAGAFDTPKILMLSGVGPVEELDAHKIKAVHILPGVGKNLQDHVVIFISTRVDGILAEKHAFEADVDGMLRAREIWAKDGTGPLAHHNGSLFGGFLKLKALAESDEFNELDADLKEYLSKPSIPAFEFGSGVPMMPPNYQLTSDDSYLTYAGILMNSQSRGEVTLRSANPKDAPFINPCYLSHAFDRKAMIELIREIMNFQQKSDIGQYFRGYIYGPKSMTDEDILEFVKEAAGPAWHANGTVMMGKSNDPNACVAPDFRVYGVKNLRVADLSVCPLTPNNHTQSTAYLVGYNAALAIIDEWQL